MNIMKLFREMEDVFPNPLTMDFIRRMKRRELAADEKQAPYAKYLYQELAEIPASDLARVNAGPMDPLNATTVYDRNDLMMPGYLCVETGYAVMPDGSGFAATLVKMPGVTPAMLEWWFNCIRWKV